MHELSIAQSIVATVAERARLEGWSRISGIGLTVGTLSGVDSHALSFCFEAAARGTIAAGARLSITEPEGTARCRECGTRFPVTFRIAPCPSCGTLTMDIESGEELAIISITS